MNAASAASHSVTTCRPVLGIMPCLFGRAESEKAELRELLELSNSQREEYRKAAEGASRRAEHVSKQLDARLCELQDLSSHYQVGGREDCAGPAAAVV